MRVLAIDTSGRTGSAAIVEDGTVVAEVTVRGGGHHAASLMPSIDHILRVTGLTVAQMDLIACTRGPGSFTGVRIGAATAKGLALAVSKPLVGVSTLEALAFGLLPRRGPLCALLDAQRGQVYGAVYLPAPDGGLVPARPEAAAAVEAFLEGLEGLGGQVLFAGDGAEAHAGRIRAALGDRARFASPFQGHVLPGAVGLLGLRKFREGAMSDPLAFTPSYLRPSEAEAKAAEKETS